jgi:hypothetical protein
MHDKHRMPMLSPDTHPLMIGLSFQPEKLMLHVLQPQYSTIIKIKVLTNRP